MTQIAFADPYEQIVIGVGEYLRANDVTAVVAGGPKARVKQTNQGPGGANRVVISDVPFEASAGSFAAAGRIVQPRQVGYRELGGDDEADPPRPPTHQVRPLDDWDQTFYVSVWGVDPDNRTDEVAQSVAARTLLIWARRAIHSVTLGNARFGAIKVSAPGESAFGREFLTEFNLQTELPDLPEEFAYPLPRVKRSTDP